MTVTRATFDETCHEMNFLPIILILFGQKRNADPKNNLKKQSEQYAIAAIPMFRPKASPGSQRRGRSRSRSVVHQRVCIMSDVLEPFRKQMIAVQSVNIYLWEISSLTTNVIRILNEMKIELKKLENIEDLRNLSQLLFPTTFKHSEDLIKNEFCGHELQEGWYILPTKGSKWTLHDFHEDVAELKKFLQNFAAELLSR